MARPVLVEETSVLSSVPIEPMMTNGMNVVKASLMALRYLFSPTTSAILIMTSSNFSPNEAIPTSLERVCFACYG